MMPYYDGLPKAYLVDGKPWIMTEEQAEEYQVEYPNVNIVSDTEIPSVLPDAAADDYLDCSCLPDPPNGTATLCNACVLYFQSLEDD